MLQQLFYRGCTAAAVYKNTLKNLYFLHSSRVGSPFFNLSIFNGQRLIEAKQAVDLVKYRT
jgi:hypothetical protein